jgi:hypothetical protein
MPFAIEKISDVGAQHPVYARLAVQMDLILKCTTFTITTRDAISAALLSAAERLVNCWKIQESLAADCDTVERELPPSPGPHLQHLPHVIGLQHKAEAFLYESKNFMRSLLSVFNIAFGTNFSEPSGFFSTKGKCSVRAWCETSFHPDDPINERLRLHEDWLREMVFKRNAVEHPGKRSGLLTIGSYQLMSDGSLRRPVWYRDQECPKIIAEDMRLLCDNMLLLAEELAVLILQRALVGTPFRICELPEQQRDQRVPVRFVVCLTEEEERRFGEAQQTS